MRKFILALMLGLFSITTVHAEKILMSGYISQMLIINSYGNWQPVTDSYGNPVGYGDAIVLSDEAIYIRFSHYKPESFRLFNVSELHYNQSGHQQMTADAVDQDGVPCNIRIVFRDDPNCEAPMQFYIHYANVDYVYNMVITANHMSSYSSGGSSRSGTSTI